MTWFTLLQNQTGIDQGDGGSPAQVKWVDWPYAKQKEDFLIEFLLLLT